MPNFRYRAITQNGEVVNGSLSAPTAAEVARRIEYLGLVPIESPPPDELKRFIASEIVRWASVVRQAGLAGTE